MKRSYVSVKTDKGWKLVEKARYRPDRKGPYIMPDIEPYIPVGGEEAKAFIEGDRNAKPISGRKAHREYLKRNNFIEVGNEKKAFLEYGGKTRENWERTERSRQIAQTGEAWLRKVARS